MKGDVAMRVVESANYGGPEVLRLAERPEPAAVPGQVRVRVAAATVHPVDLVTRAGAFAPRMPGLPMPFVLGWDLAGTLLDAAGPDLPAGARVAGMIPWVARGTGEGAYAEVAAVEPGWLAPLPDRLSFVEGGTVSLNGQTALQALDLLGLAAGETLLVTGASGSLGSFAAQLATAAGLQVLALASHGDSGYVAGLGVKAVLGRGPAESVVAAVRDLVPGGVDGVLDAALVGAPLLAAVRDGGAFVAATDPAQPPAERGIRMTTVHVEPDPAGLRSVLARAASGGLTTRLARVLPLGEAATAHRLVEAGGLRGKIVLTP